jgi:putative Mg2+ transporter-C (MgtC) family protein
LIGTVLAVIMLFGPAFSPAANAATMTASPVSVAPTVFGTQSRALGTFNFFPTKAELELCFRLLYAACSGAFIGLERSSHDRPAGVRTMALVGLGACLFTVCSIHGFLPSSALGYAPGSPMLANVKSDLARLAANVASGVGFIGAGAIHKSKLHGNGTEAQNVVAGLTTASAIWVSAAVGVASATGLYFVSLVAALSTVCILKFAKVTKDDEPGFSWGPRPLELEDQEMVQHQEKGTGAGMMHTDFGRIQETIPSTTVLHHKKKHAQQKPKVSKLGTVQLSPQGRVEIRGSKIDIKTVNDQSLEQYLRKYDKEEGYSCLEQDVRVLESRVQQSSSTFRP